MSKHLEMLHNAMKIDAQLGIGSKIELFDKQGKKITTESPALSIPDLKLGQGNLQEVADEHGNNDNNRRVAQRVAEEKKLLAKDQSGDKKSAAKPVDHHAPAREALLASAGKSVEPVVESGVAPAAAAPAAPVVAVPAWKP